MPSYKLGYFNGRGRAEVPRYLFALADVPYEDLRFNGEQWKNEFKQKTPFGVAPYLEVDGVIISDSVAISRYLAKQFGFMGGNDMDNAMIDQTLGVVGDVTNAMVQFRFYIKDEKEKEAAKEKFYQEMAPKFYGYIEKMLDRGYSGYLACPKLSLADLFAFDLLQNMEMKDPGKAVETFYERICSLPEIKAWMEARPDTPF